LGKKSHIFLPKGVLLSNPYANSQIVIEPSCSAIASVIIRYHIQGTAKQKEKKETIYVLEMLLEVITLNIL